jgi:hypothetical protein
VVVTKEVRPLKAFTLYDAGGWFLVAIFSGIYFLGLLLDYFWNYLVVSFTLKRLHINIVIKRKFVYCIIITVIGLIIDWIYFELTWGYLILDKLKISPLFPDPGAQPALELSTVLVPMVLLMVIYLFLSHPFFWLSNRQAFIFSAVTGFFTAPWLIVGYNVYQGI